MTITDIVGCAIIGLSGAGMVAGLVRQFGSRQLTALLGRRRG